MLIISKRPLQSLESDTQKFLAKIERLIQDGRKLKIQAAPAVSLKAIAKLVHCLSAYLQQVLVAPSTTPLLLDFILRRIYVWPYALSHWTSISRPAKRPVEAVASWYQRLDQLVQEVFAPGMAHWYSYATSACTLYALVSLM